MAFYLALSNEQHVEDLLTLFQHETILANTVIEPTTPEQEAACKRLFAAGVITQVSGNFYRLAITQPTIRALPEPEVA